jgi:hypothetical protein
MTRIFVDGFENSNLDDFWEKTAAENSSKKGSGLGSFWFKNQKLVKLKIENGIIILETDIAYYLGHSELLKNYMILILAECKHCHRLSEIGRLCDFCGAPMI